MLNNSQMLYRYGKSMVILLLFGYAAVAQELYPVQLKDGTWHQEQRQMRYHPEGEDFVITNGKRRFNRALYGTNTAFRVEAGDLPEFSLYMPGLGGTLKLGLIKAEQSKWLINAQKITASYKPGTMNYVIQDPLLGNGKLHVQVFALADAEGIVLKAWYEGTEKQVKLIFAFGGASAKKFSRAGDMGPDPESSFYLTAENCISNQYKIKDHSFELNYGAGQKAQLAGVFPASLKLADAAKLNDVSALVNSTSTLNLTQPVLISSKTLVPAENVYVVIKNPAISKEAVNKEVNPIEIDGKKAHRKAIITKDQKTLNAKTPPLQEITAQSAEIFNAAELARKKIANRIKVNTPDAYINTIGAAISIASDAIWEEPSYLHGSVGWRMRLNGWRGPYTADPLGWHDRARKHFEAYSKSQMTTPLTGPVIPDTAFHFARHQEKLGTSMFSSGYISRDPDGKSIRPHHYDMNLVYTDGLLWHFNWTGDLVFAKKMWPVLQRHLAWEKRNFDPDNDGLYDAYAAIWASDALYYSGGAVTHSSAYNYRANKMAAQIALLIGEDPRPYKNESEKILKAINRNLWIPEKGIYGEYKDALGLQKVHPSAALWTVYHGIDSDVPDAFQAWQSLRYIDQEIPHIPLKAAGLPAGLYYTLSTSNWMPYTWSINNVAMAESMHTALANWEAGRNDHAFTLFKSELLAAMYLGGSPGNFVQISHYDAIRGEAYRDFGDPVGISSRTLVEGLFGIVPDALHHQLTIRPGFPSDWNHAAIVIPDLDFKFKRHLEKDHYSFKVSFATGMDLKLQLKAKGNTVSYVLVNGEKVSWKNLEDAVGMPMIEINIPGNPASKTPVYEIEISWKGKAIKQPQLKTTYAAGDHLLINFDDASVIRVNDPQQVFETANFKQGQLRTVLSKNTGNKTAFVQLQSGSYTWWYPVCFELKPLISIAAPAQQEKDQLAFKLVNHNNAPIKGTLTLKSYTQQITLNPGDSSKLIRLNATQLVPGTNTFKFQPEQLPISNTELSLTGKNSDPQKTDPVTLALINWNISHPVIKQRTVDLSSYFNDQVTQIFKNKYLSPRPNAGPTLQLPWQGAGDWPHALDIPDVDDTGLKKLASPANSFSLPQGIRFNTPSGIGKHNILFTSQWDNYPAEKEVPLSGKASHAYFLMAGTTNPMQSQFDNGKIVIQYTDGSSASLILRNPETWWPIQEDYYTDGFAFNLKSPRPVRVHLKTGKISYGDNEATLPDQQKIEGGAATVLDLTLDPNKTLKSLKLKTLANDVVIGLMSITLTAD